MIATTADTPTVTAGVERAGRIERYIERRYTDPGLRLANAAEFFGVSERTLRRELNGRKWAELVLARRMRAAKDLLEEGQMTIVVVARMSGYDSATAFTAAFKRFTDGLTPKQWRMVNDGPARAGGPSGAAKLPAKRARALRDGEEPPDMRRADNHGFQELRNAEMFDAATRLADRGRRGWTVEEISEEIYGRRGFGRSGRNVG